MDMGEVETKEILHRLQFVMKDKRSCVLFVLFFCFRSSGCGIRLCMNTELRPFGYSQGVPGCFVFGFRDLC